MVADLPDEILLGEDFLWLKFEAFYACIYILILESSKVSVVRQPFLFLSESGDDDSYE